MRDSKYKVTSLLYTCSLRSSSRWVHCSKSISWKGCAKRFNMLCFMPFIHVSHEKPTNQEETSISGLKVHMTWKIIAVYGCHCFFCDEIFCSKVEEHYFNISREILYLVLQLMTSSLCKFAYYKRHSKNAIFLYFEEPLKFFTIVLHVIYTLNIHTHYIFFQM